MHGWIWVMKMSSNQAVVGVQHFKGTNGIELRVEAVAQW